MADEIVAPVKNVLKAFELGLKRAKRSKSASGLSAAQALQISEFAQSLQRSIERITEVYQLCRAECGEPFGSTLQNDDELKQRLKDLRSDVRDKIDDCEYDEDDPESFKAAAFNSVNREAQNCVDQCLAIFYNVREQVGSATSNAARMPSLPKDHRTFLTSMRQRSLSMNLPLPPIQDSLPTPAASPHENKLYLEISPAEPVKPKSPWAIESPSQFDLGAHMRPPAKSTSRSAREISPGNSTDAQDRLISTQVVQSRVRANDEFLARRRDSRLMFEKQLRDSVCSGDELRFSTATSPALSPVSATGGMGMPISPIDGRTSRSSDYQTLMTRQRSQGGASHGTRSSIASSNFQDRPNVRRRDSEDDSIFGLRAGPLSPALSEHRSSGSLEAIATTLRLPDFGEGVEQGIEVIDQVDYSTGLIPVDENSGGHIDAYQPAPIVPQTASIRSIDNPMRHDDSFFKFGGFCDGARALLRGETGFKICKRPVGNYNVMTSARCTKCSYEVNWNDAEKDRLLDRGGIYGNSGIRFRQRFLSKSHLKTKSIDDPYYACLFCVEAHKTVESNDATVFFSVTQLFRHLATHSRPVPAVAGIIIMNGHLPPEAVDFDIHFPTPEPSFHVFNAKEIAPKVATRPTATAVVTHHPKSSHSGFLDPSGHNAMHFAVGAKILGVSFPAQFNGAWCMGYHDGVRGAFPASTITLDLPAREDLLMNQSSPLVATARWDFKPKDAKDTTRGWLKFSKGEMITNIGYSFQDQWCWSGCTNKGRNWGVFPQAFVENLHEGGPLSSSPSVRHRFGLKGRMPSLPLSKSPTTSTPINNRQSSVRSTSSNGSSNRTGNHAGLEVVQSPVQATSSSGWRR